jgi:hypothetical protein
MPGLIPDVVRQFRYAGRGKLRLTPRAVQEDTGLHATAVQGSLFHELFDRIEHLERLNKPASEYRTPFVTRRPAA